MLRGEYFKVKKRSKIAVVLAMLFAISCSFIGCGKKSNDDELKDVRMCEVVRSVFYAPMYIAIEKGFFNDEGINIDLSTGQGADKVMQNVLSKNVDIGFCGPEQVVYIYNQGREDYPVVFAQLTQKDGSFLVGRSADSDFKWSDLKGKTVIGGRPGGIPEMALEYVFRDNGLSIGKDVNMVTNIDFTATSGAFASGTADYVALFEPTASMVEKSGNGKIVASIGNSAGNIAYTCFFATKSYIKEKPETVEAMSRAIYKGQQWFISHSSEEIATAIESYFPGTDHDIIVKVIDNYKKINAIAAEPTVKEEELNRLMDIIQSYDSSLIPTRPDFNTIVNNSFAEKAVKGN